MRWLLLILILSIPLAAADFVPLADLEETAEIENLETTPQIQNTPFPWIGLLSTVALILLVTFLLIRFKRKFHL